MTTSTTQHTNTPPTGPILLTIDDAADMLSLSRSTLYRLIDATEINVVRIGRAVRVPLAEVEDFVDRRRTSAQRTTPPERPVG